MTETLPNYDRWKLASPSDYEPAPPRVSGRRTAEDYLGKRVVVGQNDWGLGRWGTIVSWEEWQDEDEDGRYGELDFVVEFSDGASPHTDLISAPDADSQLFANPRTRTP